MRTKEKTPDEYMSDYACKLDRMCEVARRSGVSTLYVITSYDPLTGDSKVLVGSAGNSMELAGALQGVSLLHTGDDE